MATCKHVFVGVTSPVFAASNMNTNKVAQVLKVDCYETRDWSILVASPSMKEDLDNRSLTTRRDSRGVNANWKKCASKDPRINCDHGQVNYFHNRDNPRQGHTCSQTGTVQYVFVGGC